MTAKLLPPKVATFVQDMMHSATHRRMLHVGMVLTKVSAMFQLSPDDEVPADAKAVAIVMLEGLESGDAAEYSRCDALAMSLYENWRAQRELH